MPYGRVAVICCIAHVLHASAAQFLRNTTSHHIRSSVYTTVFYNQYCWTPRLSLVCNVQRHFADGQHGADN